MLRANAASIDRAGLAGLGKGVVAGVEVFALLEVLGQVVGFRGELAVKAEETLLIRGERLGVLVRDTLRRRFCSRGK